MNRVKRFAKNALMLGAVTILMRSISVIFNAYVTGKIGAAGIGLHSLIMSVYGFAVTLAGSGVSLAVTRIVSEELEKENHRGVIRAVRTCTLYALFFGGLSFCLLYFGAEFIASEILRDMRTYRSLRVLAVALPFISLSGVFAGYFSATRRVYKSASANLLEQLMKIALTVSLLARFVDRGIEYAALALVIGSCVSEALSFLYLFAFYYFDKRKYLHPKRDLDHDAMARRMLKISLPVALSSYLRSGLVTIEHILIPIGLRRHGADYEGALSAYGTIHGMVFPLILFPSAVCSTFAGLIVPELSELRCHYGKVKYNTHICYIVRRALTFALFFGIGTAGILLSFSEPLGLFVYGSADAGHFIRIFAPLVPIMYLDTTVDGMLKGLGEQLHSMLYNIIDASMSVLLVWTLTPRFGVYGYVICIFITELVNLSFSLSRLLSVTGANLPLMKAVVFPLFCIAGSVSFVMLLIGKHTKFASLLPLIVAIVACIALYLFLLRTTCAIDREDSRWLRGILKRES